MEKPIYDRITFTTHAETFNKELDKMTVKEIQVLYDELITNKENNLIKAFLWSTTKPKTQFDLISADRSFQDALIRTILDNWIYYRTEKK